MYASTAPADGVTYVRRGLALIRPAPWLFVAITLVFSFPALLAAWLVFSIDSPEPWQSVAIFSLPWMTLVLGTVVVMMAVSAHAHGQSVTLGQATWRALPHVPRYVWTNAHTSLVFWIPLSLVLAVREWQSEVMPLEAVGSVMVEVGWWLVIAPLALYIHTRTLLAPFLAIHGDQPATLAALDAWRLSGRALRACLSTLIVGSLPLAVPLALLALGVLAAVPPDMRQALEPALPDLAYAGIQIIRPILIPATYLLFVDLWTAEQTQRARAGEPPIPAVARLLLALTRPLPRLTPRT